jgi:hypothetical protein
MSYKCNCGYKSYKYLGNCPICKSWGSLVEIEDVKKVHRIPKVSEKKKKEIEQKKLDNPLEEWFIERRKEMTGVCLNCNKSSPKHNEKYWKWGLAHLLPKSIFNSIKTNKDNWLELCLDCHQKYDSNWDTAQKMDVFKIAKEKYLLFEDKISHEEIRRIPNCFLS